MLQAYLEKTRSDENLQLHSTNNFQDEKDGEGCNGRRGGLLQRQYTNDKEGRTDGDGGALDGKATPGWRCRGEVG